MIGYVIDFIVVRTETNFIHGVLFGGFLGFIGVHGAILWGTLTFLLGYVPYFGLLIAAVPAIFFAWLQFGIPGAVAVIVAIWSSTCLSRTRSSPISLHGNSRCRHCSCSSR